MTYAELLARLVGTRRFGVKLGLDRMRELLDRLGAPERRLGRVVHVAGTNGKGSTVAMVAALAQAGGARVAMYTSPHLSTLRERIAIDGALATEHDIVAAAERVDAAGGSALTFFEQLTAIAMVIIAEREADVTVLEVGLGGRLDATNVVDASIGAVTGVAFDHEAILGHTLAEIAAEKAGIFKHGQRAFVGASGEPDAVATLLDHARAAGVAQLTVIDDAAIARVPALALPGAHQRRNAALALAIADELGVACDRAAVLGRLQVPGRFEIAPDVGTGDAAGLILDGAHNPHGARALAATLRDRAIRPVLVAAVSADKDVAAIAEALAPEVRAVVATRYRQERALAPAALADVFRARGVSVDVADDLEAALRIARRRGAPILIAGSLFIVGEARVMCLGAPSDPIALSDPSFRG